MATHPCVRWWSHERRNEHTSVEVEVWCVCYCDYKSIACDLCSLYIHVCASTCIHSDVGGRVSSAVQRSQLLSCGISHYLDSTHPHVSS